MGDAVLAGREGRGQRDRATWRLAAAGWGAQGGAGGALAPPARGSRRVSAAADRRLQERLIW